MIDPSKKALSLFDEFKSFALKGNVIDLAVGVIIGGAFGKIVAALVEKILMPLISIVMPAEKGYTEWAWTVPGTAKSIPYGQFLGEVVNFLVIALVLFVFIVKFLGWIMKSKTETPPPALTKDQELLIEIRDLLKSQKS